MKLYCQDTSVPFLTDSYKLGHWDQYPEDTDIVHSYLEARLGAMFNETIFFGLQGIIKQYLTGQVLWQSHIYEGKQLAANHFGDESLFNAAGWEHILKAHEGHLPIRIKAVREGTSVPVGNVLMTVENTDPKCYWLTNYVESLLMHVWYPCTVATLSHSIKKDLSWYLEQTSDNPQALSFMLHDFGFRGVSSVESAEHGGAAHLINFLGTDTVPAMLYLNRYYNADPKGVGFSVPATEHSIMTAERRGGEAGIVGRLLKKYPSGVLSLVADSYSIYYFVENILPSYRGEILARTPNKNGVPAKLVVRPDSMTKEHHTPGEQVVWILRSLENTFGGYTNSKGYRVLNKVGVLWGDGIDKDGVIEICHQAMRAGYSAENLVFGMGGGLLQKVNRDTQRFAFKCSARHKKTGEWVDIFKDPLDSSKASKKGRLKLVKSFTSLALEGQKAGIRVYILALVALTRLTEDLAGMGAMKDKLDPALPKFPQMPPM